MHRVLDFPIHCGTGLLIGVALANKYVLRTDVKAWPVFILAVFVQGLPYAINSFISTAVSNGPWSSGAFFVAEAAIAIALMLYCRAVLKSLGANIVYETLERSHQDDS